MTSGSSSHLNPRHFLTVGMLAMAMLALSGCGLKVADAPAKEYERFDLTQVRLTSNPPRPRGVEITDYAVEYVVDLGTPDGQPGHSSEVRVVLPRHMPAAKVPTLVVNGAGAYLFSGMVLSDEDIEPMLPYVEQGFAIVAYETDGCQPDFNRDPTAADISLMTRNYVASKAGLVNAKRALSYALQRFPEINGDQLYTIGHSSGGKQALLLAAHDERIRGCVAFAPACRMDFASKMTVARIGGPNADMLAREVNRSMPIAHAKNTKVPMLLVFSPSDRVTRPDEVISYAKAVGKSAKAIPVQCDGHGSVPEAGFPLAMMWLRIQTKLNDNAPAIQLAGGSAETNVMADSADEQHVIDESAKTAVEQTPVEDVDSVQTSTEQQEVNEIATPRRLAAPARIPSMPQQFPLPAGVQRNPYAAD